LYLQCDPGEEIEAWPDERIWQELHTRFGTDDGWELGEGPIIEKGITPMRSFVVEPMQWGRLFLAGDAAHIVPPTGAKGLNLAVHDVGVLASALIEWYRSGDRAGLDAYSETCLRRVWRVQHFSAWMTAMLHRQPDAGGFEQRLQLAQLEYVCRSEAAARTLAENYVGLERV
jgi:p-hydroxybenzoate 3-monooxygenase